LRRQWQSRQSQRYIFEELLHRISTISAVLQNSPTSSTHTHTHPFNGPLSGTSQVSRYQKGKTNLDFIGTVSGSGIGWAICKSTHRSRQITTPVPDHSVFYRPDALSAAQPTASKHRRRQAEGDTHTHTRTERQRNTSKAESYTTQALTLRGSAKRRLFATLNKYMCGTICPLIQLILQLLLILRNPLYVLILLHN